MNHHQNHYFPSIFRFHRVDNLTRYLLITKLKDGFFLKIILRAEVSRTPRLSEHAKMNKSKNADN
ncbi:hypothetical protein HMPREF9103_00175 [Lentilactobacillus parafarraginis F0439]|uniref:Uncharacterized protein n=1 Tax=Lentilactobacillus parafarraginis F0439 TaxID=797515 RepID=G9ZKC6_9LACO|nr:hypothetical protein HMPREF9103_00175 [Lentilactobacillus parafarraginis F0439]